MTCEQTENWTQRKAPDAKALLLACALAFCGSAAIGQEITLSTDAPEETQEALNAASLLRSLDDTALPQDYVAAARADYRRLLTALYAEGYYSGSISITVDGAEAANISPLAAPASIGEVVIAVASGRRFSFGDVQIAPLAAGTVLPEDLGPRRTARSGRIQTAAGIAINSWRDIGYAKARVTSQSIVARHADAKLDVTVGIETGPRLRFGALTVGGDSRVSDDRIRQIAGLPVGDVYSPADLVAAERRLRATSTFASVAFTEGDVVAGEDTLPIRAQISDANLRRIGFGVELATLEGLTLSSFWLHRNLLGGAERARVDVEVSGIAGETGGVDYRLGGSFTRPASLGPDTDYYLLGEISREDEPEYLLDQISLETGYERRVSDDLTVRAGIGLLRAREETDVETRSYTLLTLPTEATYDMRDNPTNAKEGYYVNLNATPFVSVDGDIAGGRFFGDLRGYLTFGADENVTLAARGQLGSVGGASTSEAPADFLFYSGGSGTVRGQAYQSLGIDTVSGTETVTTGGTSFIGAQLEARVAFGDNLSLVGFYDVGHVGDTAIPAEGGDWHAGAGVGLRYNTGIGPIRLDLGTQASGDNAGEDLQVYIGIGQSF